MHAHSKFSRTFIKINRELHEVSEKSKSLAGDLVYLEMYTSGMRPRLEKWETLTRLKCVMSEWMQSLVNCEELYPRRLRCLLHK